MWLQSSSQCEAQASSWPHVLVPSLLPQEKRILGGQPQLIPAGSLSFLMMSLAQLVASKCREETKASLRWHQRFESCCVSWSTAEDLGHDVKQTLAVAMLRREGGTSSICG